MRLLDPDAVAPTPWRNGAGATRELAHAADAEGELQWRVSVADLDRDADFSAFPGLDRLFIPLDPVRLRIDGTARDIDAEQQIGFPGEAVVSVEVAHPTRALNAMVRRGAFLVSVHLRPSCSPAARGADLSVALGAVAADVHLTCLMRKESRG